MSAPIDVRVVVEEHAVAAPEYQSEHASGLDLVAATDEATLADIIFTRGEERHSRRIARAIVAARGA